MNEEDQKLVEQSLEVPTEMTKFDPATMPVDAGTEEMTRDDLNTPTLRLIQKLSDTGLLDPHIGWYFRSDTQTQLEHPLVDLVYVTTSEQEKFDKTKGKENVKIYFGFYHGTKEPFKMYVRGWSLAGHRNFQTQVMLMKSKYRTPMLGLTVELGSQDVEGKLPTGGNYSTKATTFTIQTELDGKPIIDLDVARADFLYNSIESFKQTAMIADGAQESDHDLGQNR